MNLSENNYFKFKGVQFENFGYESANNMYDCYVDLITGELSFGKNLKPCEKTKYHEAIIQHFKLNPLN